MLLSQIMPEGVQLTEYMLGGALMNGASMMYQNGWTVIGSRYKTPNLHPWKTPAREELLTMALANLQSGRANSINIRLTDTSTVALDCDFASHDLTEAFIAAVAAYMAVPRSALHTVCGARGCKVFFRCRMDGLMRRIPQYLGPRLTSMAGLASTDTALEVKTTVSTVAGMHSFWTQDGIVYGPYPGTSYICEVRPGDLIEVQREDLDMMKSIYDRIVSSSRAYFSPGEDSRPYEAPGYAQVTAAAVALFFESCPGTVSHSTNLCSLQRPDEYEMKHHEPLYTALGLYEAWSCVCSHFWPGTVLPGYMKHALPPDRPDVLGRLTIDPRGTTRLALHNAARRAEELFRRLHTILYKRALKLRLNVNEHTSTTALYKALYEHNSGGNNAHL